MAAQVINDKICYVKLYAWAFLCLLFRLPCMIN